MYAQEPWFDRVHNVIFDWLVAGGVVGLLTYLSLYATSLWALWRGSVFSALNQSILTGLLAGYFFYLLFTFDNIMSYVMFTAVIAYIATRTSEKAEPVTTKALIPFKAAPLVAISAVLVVGASVWGANASAYAANRTLIQGLSPQQGGIAVNLEKFKEALAYNSFGTQEVREHLSQTAAQIGGMAEASADIKKTFYDLAISEMQKQSDEVPASARFPFFLGILKDTFGDHEGARVALQKAHENSPGKQAIAFQLAMNAVARGSTGEATALLEQAYVSAPEYREAALLYALALVSSGQFDKADPIVSEIADGTYTPDQRLLGAYVSQGRYDKVATLMSLYIAKHPDDAKARVTEAAALYAGGNKEAAVRSLEETQKVIPQSASAAAALIQQVKAGTWNVK
jgi:Flp pilus assembly protein TadD